MPKFDVRVFEIIRIRVDAVEAETAEEACVKARDGYDPEGLLRESVVTKLKGEYADETSHYFVSSSDPGDALEKWFLATKRGPVPMTGQEMASLEDKVLDIVLPKKDWNVPVCRTGFGHNTLTVRARTEREAVEKALYEAGNHEYSEKEADYSADDGAMEVPS